MKSKFVLSLLAAMSCAVVMTGCGNKSKNDAAKETTTNQKETAAATDTHNGVVGDAENLVSDVVQGGEDIVSDVVGGGEHIASDVVDGNGGSGTAHTAITDNHTGTETVTTTKATDSRGR